MARIKLGSIVTDLSGSAGGGTIQNSRSGYILRNKPTPCNPTSASQLSIRSKIKTLQRAWIKLTDQQRHDWNNFPSYANQFTNDRYCLLSGHALFIKYQLFRLYYNQPLLTNPVYVPMIQTPSILKIDNYSPTGLALWWTFIINPFYHYPFIKFTKPKNPSSPYNYKGLRLMPLQWYNHAATNIGHQYSSFFGFIPNVGDTIDWSLQFFSNLSPLFSKVTKGSIIIV